MSENVLKLSEGLSLPKAAATWVFAYLAKRGGGKTYNAAVEAEEMVWNGIPIVVVDGMGIWWGLRVGADGKGPGLPVVVFGGEHADLPLTLETAAEIARAIVESNINAVLDISEFSKTQARKVVTAFLDELYRLNRVDRHVFIEESDMFGPQKPFGPEAVACLEAIDTFVRRGGNKNLGCTLITQRSAVLNKNILTQSDCLVVLRTKAPQDKAAVRAWIEENVDADNAEEVKKAEDMMKSLGTLKNGEAWVWHTDEPYVFAKFLFRRRKTFHATREFIKSPEAANVKLMDASEFISKFKAVFQGKSALMHSTSAQQSVEVSAEHIRKVRELETEVEEFRSGRKLADSVKGRLEFLGKVKVDLAEKIKAQDEELKLYDELKSVLRRLLDVQKIYDNIHRVEEKIPTAIPTNGQTVGLQPTTTIIDVLPVERYWKQVNAESVTGKILTIAKQGKLDGWRQLGEIVKAVEEEKWTVTPQQINNALNELVKDGLIAKKHTDRNYFCLAQGVKFKEAS